MSLPYSYVFHAPQFLSSPLLMGRMALQKLANLLGLPISSHQDHEDQEIEQAPRQGCPASLLQAILLASEPDPIESAAADARVASRTLVCVVISDERFPS